jgi:hypothetical protein
MPTNNSGGFWNITFIASLILCQPHAWYPHCCRTSPGIRQQSPNVTTWQSVKDWIHSRCVQNQSIFQFVNICGTGLLEVPIATWIATIQFVCM